MGYLYNNFGIGKIPKIPLIKIGVGNHWQGERPGQRTVLISTGREGARTDGPLFLVSKSRGKV